MLYKISVLKHHREKLVVRNQGVGDFHRCYGVAENIKRLNDALASTEDAIKKRPEYVAYDKELQRIRELNIAARKTARDKKNEDSDDVVQVSPDRAIVAALESVEEEFDNEMAEFVPYKFNALKTRNLTEDDFGPDARPSPKAVAITLNSDFHSFVATFEAIYNLETADLPVTESSSS